MNDIVDRLDIHGREVLTTERPSSFEAAVERFTQTLATIPDSPAAELSDEGFAHVNALAEQVISQIERRLEADDIGADVRERMAESIYDIRRALEEAFRWRKHYLRQ
ncbi:MAG TPA: hypothetical protein VFA59_18770 [Vicinamibacterales bacterium]|nr:hypothetical protein [Vicinamibacterales bacterium]